jgi:hypothetical protein
LLHADVARKDVTLFPGKALCAADVTKLVQETMFVTRARFWAGKFSLCETNPAHNERGGSPSPSMPATHARATQANRGARHRVHAKPAKRQPCWTSGDRYAASMCHEWAEVLAFDVTLSANSADNVTRNATPDPPGSVNPHPAPSLPR